MSQIPNKQPLWKVSPGGPKHFINSVAVSADGGRVVGGTYYHDYGQQEARRAPVGRPAGGGTGSAPSPTLGKYGVYCYNGSGQPLWQDEFASSYGVYWVAMSADGSRAAAGGLMFDPNVGFVRAYDASSGRLLLCLSTQGGRINQVALSGDGQWLVSAGDTLRLFRYDATTLKYEQAAEFTPDSSNGIVNAAISKDGRTVVYADYAWKTTDPTTKEETVHPGRIGVFSNDLNTGTLTALAKWELPKAVAPAKTTEADFCHMIDLAPDGTVFAAGGAAGLIYYFDVASFTNPTSPTYQQPTYQYNTGVAGAVYGVAVAQTGGRFVGVVNKDVTIDNQKVELGSACLVSVGAGGAQCDVQLSLKCNPNSAALHGSTGLLAIADGHPDGTPGHYYLYYYAPGVYHLRWIFQTGNMSWPIVISANGNAVVGGSDDTNIYYFAP